VATSLTFAELVAQAESAPVTGWDFGWLAGRASEERPPWGYSGLLADRMSRARAALDVQTGGGEVLAGVPRRPPVLVATESWPPNVELASHRLAPLGVAVVAAGDEDGLPFRQESFDLVTSRHPTVTVWREIARVLAPGGSYLSQQIGAGSNRELTAFMMGPQPAGRARSPRWAAAQAAAAGLTVTSLRTTALRVTFSDAGAVVYFLRKVVWTVPGFTVAAYRDRLAELHERIQRHGPFVCHSQRFLIEAVKPKR
jgi:SAM-dependent methyltransferase